MINPEKSELSQKILEKDEIEQSTNKFILLQTNLPKILFLYFLYTHLIYYERKRFVYLSRN